MNLEIGKCYKTRDGKKVVVIGDTRLVNSYVPRIYVCDIDSKQVGIDWYAVSPDGRYGEYHETERDVVSEWKDPLKVEGWVNVYDYVFSSIYPTRELANIGATPSRVACIYVSGTEGVEK